MRKKSVPFQFLLLLVLVIFRPALAASEDGDEATTLLENKREVTSDNKVKYRTFIRPASDTWRHLQVARDNITIFYHNSSTVAPNATDPKIIGGTAVSSPHVYPFFTGVGPYAQWICGGDLIAPDVLLTAAHCQDAFPVGGGVIVNAFREMNPYTPGAVYATVVEQLVDPLYVSFLYNDLLLVKISPPVTSVDPIEINFDPNIPSQAQARKMTIVGFGLTADGGSIPYDLQQAVLPEVPYKECHAVWNDVTRNQHICVRQNSPLRVACKGDSGGPLLIKKNGKWLLIGSLSYGGLNCTYGPSVYNRLSGQTAFLQNICHFSDYPPAYFNCGILTARPRSVNSISSQKSKCSVKQKIAENCLAKIKSSQATPCTSCINSAYSSTKATACNVPVVQKLICQTPQSCSCSTCTAAIRSYLKCLKGCSKCNKYPCIAQGDVCKRDNQCCSSAVIGNANNSSKVACKKRKCSLKSCRPAGSQCHSSSQCCSSKCKKRKCS